MNQPWKQLCIGIVAITYVVLCSLGAQGCPATGANATATCLQCHNGNHATDVGEFPRSAHRRSDCIDCHGNAAAHVRNGGRGGLFVANPEKFPLEQQVQVCSDCHAGQSAQYTLSEHYVSGSVSCYDCHDVHEPDGALTLPAVDNTLCLSCHGAFNFPTDVEVTAHTHHNVDPAGTGASRCTACHMPLLLNEEDRKLEPNDHTLRTIPPIVSVQAAEAEQPVPPNTCMGAVGCHDGSSPGEPNFDLNNPDHMRILQILYETWFPGAPGEPDAN